MKRDRKQVCFFVKKVEMMQANGRYLESKFVLFFMENKNEKKRLHFKKEKTKNINTK